MEEMTRKELWQWELVGCCEMQVAALREKLRRVAAVDEWLMDLKMFEGTLQPSIKAAPIDETLFDSVCLMAQFFMGGGVMLRGSIRYWSPSESYSQGGDVRLFRNIDECIAWLEDEKEAAKVCAEKLEEYWMGRKKAQTINL